ncbi:hypothetical protein NN561_008412 [Cricetulus griseus]
MRKPSPKWGLVNRSEECVDTVTHRSQKKVSYLEAGVTVVVSHQLGSSGTAEWTNCLPGPRPLCIRCFTDRPLNPGSRKPCPEGRTLAHPQIPLLLPGGTALRATFRRCARREKAVPARQDAHAEKGRSLGAEDGATQCSALVFAALGPRPASELRSNTVKVLCPGAAQCQT